MALMPFLGPTVEHALTDSVGEISVILSGVVIGIAFFGNAIPNDKRVSR
jgi:hypothetical protein